MGDERQPRGGVRAAPRAVTVIYDGDCPFCSRYTDLLALRSVAEVELINARDDPALAARLQARGLDLNAGMVAVVDGQAFHGAEAVVAMAKLAPRASAFACVNAWAFRSPRVARAAYPILRLGRAVSLWVLGRGKIPTGPA
jgi:predicted DCC family thiol-disulfide oxidoreductase YuxK